MKKNLSILVLLAIVGFGAIYFVSDKAKQEYDRILANVSKTLSDAEIKNAAYEKGFLASSDSYELVVKKEIMQKIGASEELILKVDTQINHGLDAIFSGAKISSKIYVQNGEYKNFAALFFGSNLVATADVTATLDGKKYGEIRLSDVNMAHEDDKFTTKNIAVKIDSVKHKISKIALNVDGINFDAKKDGEDIKIDLQNLFYAISYFEPIDPEAFLNYDYALVPLEYTGGFKKIAMKINGNEEVSLNVQDGSYKGATDVKNGLLSDKAEGGVALIDANGEKFKDLKIVSELENFNVEALKKLYKKIDEVAKDVNFESEEVLDGYKDKIFEALLADTGELLASDPSVKISEFSIKNGKDKKLNLSVNFGVKSYDKNKDISQNLSAFIFDGELKVNGGIGEFLYQVPEIALLEPVFVENGILQKQDGDTRVKFKLDSQNSDIVFNDKISLSKMLSSIF